MTEPVEVTLNKILEEAKTKIVELLQEQSDSFNRASQEAKSMNKYSDIPPTQTSR